MSEIVKGDLVRVVKECCPANLIGIVSSVHGLLPAPPAPYSQWECTECGRPLDCSQGMVVIDLPCRAGSHTHPMEWPKTYVVKIEPPQQTVTTKREEPCKV